LYLKESMIFQTDHLVCVFNPLYVSCLIFDLYFLLHIADLLHLRAVDSAAHVQFAKDHGMAAFVVSAKSGDNVEPVFYRAAATMAGIKLSNEEIVGATRAIQAEIVNHQQHDPAVPETLPKQQQKKKNCVIQ
jgi:hypothetical protein